MATLNDFLKNLPQKPVEAKPSQQEDSLTQVKDGSAFMPEISKCYEVHFGEIEVDGKTGFGVARIRANGLHAQDWIDLDSNEQLARNFGRYVVKAFREISCSDSNGCSGA